MTALDLLRVLAWPLVVLVVALGVFRRVDIWRDLEQRLVILAGSIPTLRQRMEELERKCLEDRGVNARTAQAVADATVELEKISAQVQRMELRPPGGVGIRR